MEIVIYEKILEKGKDVDVGYNFLDCKKKGNRHVKGGLETSNYSSTRF